MQKKKLIYIHLMDIYIAEIPETEKFKGLATIIKYVHADYIMLPLKESFNL